MDNIAVIIISEQMKGPSTSRMKVAQLYKKATAKQRKPRNIVLKTQGASSRRKHSSRNRRKLLIGLQTNIKYTFNKILNNVRLELLKKPDGCSELRRAGFVSGNKRESGANQERLGLAQLFLDQGF